MTMPDLGSVTMMEFLGQDSQSFLKQLTDANLDESSRRFIIGEYIREKGGRSLRTFAFSAASSVASASPGCASAFAPTFTHREWKDGEDLVVAEGITGFNVRFNALKADLDAIKADLTKTFDCLASLQKTVAGAMVEIAAEFNAVNRQIYDCCAKSGDGIMVGPPVRVPPFVNVVPDIGVLTGPYGPRVNPAMTYEAPFVYPAGDLRSPAASPRIWRDASDPNKGLIGGMDASRIDVATINGKTMDVWKTQLGLILTETMSGAEVVKPAFVPTELERAREFARFLGDNEADIKTAFPAGFTAREFNDKFGGTRLAGGSPVANLMKGLPDDMAFDSTGKLADAVTDATAKAVTESGLAQPTIVGTIGLNADAEVKNVPLESLKAVDEQTATALRNAGITTLGQLSEAEPTRLKETLDGAGIRTSIGDAAGLRGLGRAITRVGRRTPG
jgi:hypothetical protein